jgi:hypothetical protein
MSVKPGRYAKAITVAAGQAIVYIQLYGATWHLVPAVTGLGIVLAVFGVPNSTPPAQ